VTRDNDLYRQLHITVVEIAAGYPGELRLPGHIGELGLPGHTRELGYPGQISPTTDHFRQSNQRPKYILQLVL